MTVDTNWHLLDVDNLLAAVRRDSEGATLEVKRRLAEPEDLFVLPVSVTDAIRNTFGGGKKTFDPMTRRCRFAWKVWDGKYGPLNPEQAIYAEKLLVSCFNGAKEHPNPRALLYTRLSSVVNHEMVHGGMKERADEGVDILEALTEAFA